MHVLRHTICLVLLALSLPAMASVQHYEARYAKSAWEVSWHAEHCEVGHAIPRYGRAVFRQAAGGGLEFAVRSQQPAPAEGTAVLRSLTPPWKESRGQVELSEVLLAEGETPFRLGSPLALRVLYELEAGRMPAFEYRDWADGQNAVKVVISPLNFLPALAQFRECLAQLPPPKPKIVQSEAPPRKSPIVTQAPSEKTEVKRKLKYRILRGGQDEVLSITLPGEG